MDHDIGTGELAQIRALMSESQELLTGTWRHQLIWGLVTALGLSGTWVTVRLEAYGASWWIWGVVIVVGWACSMLIADQDPVQNVATRAFGGIWFALGVTLTLMGTVPIITGAMHPAGLPGILALVLGAGYFASGVLAGFRWLLFVGVAWWASGVALLAFRGVGALLAFAFLAITLEALPALKLRSMERARSAST